jgi:hypothetical protein
MGIAKDAEANPITSANAKKSLRYLILLAFRVKVCDVLEYDSSYFIYSQHKAIFMPDDI